MHRLKTAAVSAAFFAFLWGTPTLAEPVTLSTPDNANVLTGELLEFDGDLYRLETKYGVLTLHADRVTCAGVDCPDVDTLVQSVRITGSEGIDDVLLPALIRAFAQRNNYQLRQEPDPDGSVRFRLAQSSDEKQIGVLHLVPTTTAQAFADLIETASDIVLARRAMTIDERQAATTAHIGDFLSPTRSSVFALDALVPVVDLKNPTRTISIPDLYDVLNGEITNWSELGGTDRPISVGLPKDGSGLREVVEDAFDLQSAPAPVGGTDDPLDLTLVPFSKLGIDQPLSLSGSCGYTTKATRRSIKTEDYPLTMPVFLYTPARRLSPLARDFITFTKTVSAQTVIRRSGLVDQLPEEIEINQQGLRFLNAIRVIEPDQGVSVARRMVGALEGKARLTMSFRFREGLSDLNAHSRSNIELLSQAIESGLFAERELTFVGFSDGVGSGTANLAISQKRADTVRSAVALMADRASLKRVDMRTDAFGEAMPMACDDSTLGRHVNRRVEVWVR